MFGLYIFLSVVFFSIVGSFLYLKCLIDSVEESLEYSLSDGLTELKTDISGFCDELIEKSSLLNRKLSREEGPFVYAELDRVISGFCDELIENNAILNRKLSRVYDFVVDINKEEGPFVSITDTYKSAMKMVKKEEKAFFIKEQLSLHTKVASLTRKIDTLIAIVEKNKSSS